jgi:hypothetical protein
MKTLTYFFYLLFIVFFSTTGLFAQQKNNNEYIRGDAKIEFKWRYGYGEYGGDIKSLFNQQEVQRGTQVWVDGVHFSGSYKNWNNDLCHGVQLLYRGGTPVSRTIRCVSEIVPIAKAGLPVTFAIPVHVSVGTEEQVSVALKISGQGDEIVSFSFIPQRKTTITSANSKIDFHLLKLNKPNEKNPGYNFTGMLHVRVYPGLLNYGGRMSFEFNSNTKHMESQSMLTIGSIWKDLSKTNVDEAWLSGGLNEEILSQVLTNQHNLLEKFHSLSNIMSADLSLPAKVIVSCADKGTSYDRGETRLQAYSGNPVKDYQVDTPSDKMLEIATSVSSLMGKKFSIFRYQHHHLLWDANNPDILVKEELAYLDKWLLAAKATSENVILDLQISPFTRAYKNASQMGTIALPKEGVPGFTWDMLVKGYVTTIRYAKEKCPQLSIVQMPYEFDNWSSFESHRDAHYQLFRVLYRAVNEVNATLPKSQQIQVAGLSVNNPETRWDYIDGFLQRYAADSDPGKRLDYLTWHTYLFPGSNPNTPKGYNAKLIEILKKHNLDINTKVLVDELGLAEPSTIEDLSDLVGASRKEAAMACFSAAIHDWYLREKGNFTAISGAGWHFGALTYGHQNVLSPYAKGMVLRSRLGDATIPSIATPQDDKGYGLYSFATKVDKKLSVLVWSASPAIFYSNAKALNYPKTEVVFNDIPAEFQNGKLKVTIQSSAPDQENILNILSQDKCQTLPLTRGADRYYIDFTPEEVKVLNTIPSETRTMTATGNTLTVPVDVHEYGMYLITVEKGK